MSLSSPVRLARVLRIALVVGTGSVPGSAQCQLAKLGAEDGAPEEVGAVAHARDAMATTPGGYPSGPR